MANYEAVTVSSYNIIIPEKQREALKEVLKGYVFPSELTVGLEEDGSLVAYGYEPFQAYPSFQDGEIDWDSDVTNEFLQELCPFIPEGQEWKVAQVGFEKCRYVTAWCATITYGGVTYQTLDTP